MTNDKLRKRLADLTSAQRRSLRRALSTMLRDGIRLTRDGLRDRAQVDTSAASTALAAYRAGCFEVELAAPDEAQGAAPPAAPQAEGGGLARQRALGLPESADTIAELGDEALTAASYVNVIFNARRRVLALRVLELLVAGDEAGDPDADDPDAEVCAALGLGECYELREGDAAAAELRQVSLPPAWEELLRGQVPAPAASKRPARARAK